jgi:hypothetical protein
MGASSVTGTGHGSAEHRQLRGYDLGNIFKILKTIDGPSAFVDHPDRITGSVTTNFSASRHQEMHKITASEDAQGYFTLTYVPIDPTNVTVDIYRGPRQVNKNTVGDSGAVPDFDILNGNELHFNNNGIATGLREYIAEDDVLIIVYDY